MHYIECKDLFCKQCIIIEQKQKALWRNWAKLKNALAMDFVFALPLIEKALCYSFFVHVWPSSASFVQRSCINWL
jgi:hypothetical protein